MKLGIIGPQFAGKTTLIKVLGYKGNTSSNIVLQVKVPDERLLSLNEIFKPKKLTHVSIEILDSVGKIGKEDIKESDSLSKLRNCDGFIIVIGLYTTDNITLKDIINILENYKSNMILSDMMVIEKRIEKINNLLKKGIPEKTQYEKEKAFLQVCNEYLEKGKFIKEIPLDEFSSQIVKNFQFFTSKPYMIVLNISENALSSLSINPQIPNEKDIIISCLKIEEELMELEKEERTTFMKELGIKHFTKDSIIKSAYKILNMITFFTAGEKEVRAWAIEKGSSILKAAGKIHSDMEKGFIRAEIIHYTDFIKVKSYQKASQIGLLQTVGKDYIVQDGDLVHIKFNV